MLEPPEPPAPPPRLLFVGHFERPHDDEVVFNRRFRIRRFSVVPGQSVAHGVSSRTQSDEWELEALRGAKEDDKDVWSPLAPRCAGTSGTFDVGERAREPRRPSKRGRPPGAGSSSR